MEAKINLNIGELPSQPGIESYIEIASGENSIAQAKERASAEVGSDINSYNLYAVIGCSSAEGAECVKTYLSNEWNNFWARYKDDYTFGKFFSSFIGCNPAQDINVNGTSVIIHGLSSKIELENSNEEEKVGSYDQTILIDINTGQEIRTILRGENPIVDAFDALKLKISFYRSSFIPEDFWNHPACNRRNRESNEFRFFKTLLTILKSGDLELNFKSARELPEFVKEEAKSISESFFFSGMMHIVFSDCLYFLGEYSEHTTGEFYGFLSTDSRFTKVKVKAPGLFCIQPIKYNNHPN
ncbi:unnamed protein product [Blepharisma stoltei]|uniref:Uncharacterized protein n=1 Tax=Blepharisma stoltei TaxID=1481888 RepID=A0AAU9II79_9CILI|nr:unnamed protein product [Blepharisma stoltei]